MATLFANIGTSDIAIKIEDYYIPVGFDRNEPNVDDSDLNENEKAIWEQDFRKIYIGSELCPELGVKVSSKNQFSFRELTLKILENYLNQDNENNWHNRIKPGRIQGIVQTACEKFNIDKVYFFVTDQPEKITDKKTGEEKTNKGYFTDSIHLFSILKKWLKRQYPNLTVIEEIIPKSILPVEQDELLNHYYQFFLNCTKIQNDEEIIISIKGGTYQMQNALRMQSIASSSRILFIEPQLSIKKLLNGQASECKFISYWRYQRNQKYQDIKVLLETRWDFTGAIKILEQWQFLLEFWKQNTQDIQLSNNSELISRIIKTLAIANNCLNLDFKAAKQVWQGNSQFRKKLSANLIEQVEKENRLLNLYTQCRIYDELGQTANFLSRMSSFYEAVLERIARKLNFYQEFNQLPNRNRPEKRDLVASKLECRSSKERENWQKILQNLESLDYWCTQRNNLIHDSEGVSKQTMRNLYNNLPNKKNTCAPDLILDKMTQIMENYLIKIPNKYRQFIEKNTKYYIYSAAKDWVVDKLFTEGLQ